MAKKARPPYAWAFWGAVLVTVGLWLIPFGGLLIWPFSVLSTWAHEMGHGVTGIMVGGTFDHLELYLLGGGMAFIEDVPSGGAQAAISAGGLLGAPLLGAAFVAFGADERVGRAMLLALSGAIALSTLFFIRSVFGLVACPLLALGLGWAALRWTATKRFVLVQFVGIQLALSAVGGLDYLFSGYAVFPTGRLPSDVANIATAIGGHYLLWGVLIFVFELGLLVAAYKMVSRRLDRDESY